MRCLSKHSGRDRIQMGGGLLKRPARFEPPYHSEPPGEAAINPVIFAIDDGFGANRRGHVKVAPHFDADEASLIDANDLDGMAVERDLPSYDRRVASVCALPERVADDCAGRAAAALIIGAREDAPHRGPNSERVEEISAHPQPVFRKALLAARGQIESRGAPGEEAVKSLLPFLKQLPERIGQFRTPPVEIPRSAARNRNPHLG